MNQISGHVFTFGVLLLLGAPPALTQESYRRLEGGGSIEIRNDYFFAADDPNAKLNDLFADAELDLTIWFTPAFSLQTELEFTPVSDPGPADDRLFEDHGLAIKQLFLRYETGAFAFHGGKFNPPFGLAWDLAPGIYGADFAGDYELDERIGLGGAIAFDGDIDDRSPGVRRLSAAAFFADTTSLSRSIFTDRGRLTGAAGGVGNTDDLSSFSITFDGGGLAFLPEIRYHLGYEFQKRGEGDPENERGVVTGLHGEFEADAGLRLEAMVELACLAGAEGQAQDRTYVTAGGMLSRAPWSFALVYAWRATDADDPALSDADDHLFQLSTGYEFTPELRLDLGYRFSRENGGATHAVGLLFTYSFDLE